MAAIFRIKRKRDEDPLENLVLNCKRFKKEGSEARMSCRLTYAGSAKSSNDCFRIVRSALHLVELDKKYPDAKSMEEPMDTGGEETAMTRPIEGIEVVTSMGAQRLDALFQEKSKLVDDTNAEETSTSRYRLLDLKKKTEEDAGEEECIYDVFFTVHPTVVKESLIDFSLHVYHNEILEDVSEDEDEKEEIDLERNYFDDDVDDENYWDKDYPDEFNVFYKKEDEDGGELDDDNKSSDDDNDENLASGKDEENDYGDYICDFVDKISKEQAKRSRKILKSIMKQLDECDIKDK